MQTSFLFDKKRQTEKKLNPFPEQVFLPPLPRLKRLIPILILSHLFHIIFFYIRGNGKSQITNVAAGINNKPLLPLLSDVGFKRTRSHVVNV